jgi:hypothetical protein
VTQLSRPLLIALVAVAGFAGVWMTVLRPKGGAAATPAPAAAASTAVPGGAVIDKARAAVAASDVAAAKAQAATGTPAPAPATSAPSAPASTTPAPLTAAPPASHPAADARPIVLLFAGSGADDAAARAVVRSVRRKGVRTIIAPIGRVADYQRLTGTVAIESAPTILVIGPDHRAQRIVGLPDRAQVEQALAGA